MRGVEGPVAVAGTMKPMSDADRPPVPQYGEYAPPGSQPPPPAGEPVAPPPYGAASFPPQPGEKKRKTWDVVLTIILLVIGLFGASFGVVYGVLFTDPALLDQALQQQGYGGFSGDAGAAPLVLIVSHAVLYLIAVGGSIPLLISRRVAFWLPLAAGIVAAIIFWSTMVSVLMSDPGFMSQLS